MAEYVIKSWKANEQPQGGGVPPVRIEARAGGLLSWLLNILQISPTISLSVSEDMFTFQRGSLSGSETHNTPLENVCSTFYGYTKPWKEALWIGVIVSLLTFWLACLPGILAGLLYYYLKKTLTLGYIAGGQTYRIDFRRSVIEGQNIDETEAARVCAIVQKLVDGRRVRVVQVKQTDMMMG